MSHKLSVYKKIHLSLFPSLFHFVRKELKDCDSVLDIGCGRKSPLRFFLNNKYSVGVDVFEPAIEESKERNIHTKYILADITKDDFISKFGDEKFDCVIALDLIEHLPKEEGYKILENMQKLSKNKIILFTPNGFLKQDQEVVKGNPFQEHKSGWNVQDFKKLGFKVKGINGPKFLRGIRAIIKFKPKKLWYLVSELSQYITQFIPNKSFHLLCIKKKK